LFVRDLPSFDSVERSAAIQDLKPLIFLPVLDPQSAKLRWKGLPFGFRQVWDRRRSSISQFHTGTFASRLIRRLRPALPRKVRIKKDEG
jgi:hypothetical protein